ncbi:glycosyltransferase family 4 protein [Pararhizobium haloflavum]|uniref:glycosyltransferase family 4 protein n=1 Tax=Pararhizobium haloflavum TaxID=2037914 RepID=UPI000C175CE4|nr:glycosyltransferase family 1 protein [Pararhizobium haloflavum]
MGTRVILSVEAVRYPLTGTGRYAYELSRHLPHVGGIDDLRYFGMGGFLDSAPEPSDEGSAAVGWIKRTLQKSNTVVALRQSALDWRRRRALLAHDEHVFHGPNYYLPPRQGPNVVTIHDLSIFTMPECHPPARVRYMRKQIRLSLKRATHLITDCDYTKNETAAYFDWPQDRVTAIPLASSDDFRPRDETQTRDVLAELGLEHEGYCLYAGTIEPRKNVMRLLDAYEGLPAAIRTRFPLVLVGHRGWQSEAAHEKIERAVREGWAVYPGYVPNAHLPLLFAGARLFVLPSLYEGFGLPILEAMASGTPVIVSRNSSLPEVAGDAALYVEAEDTAELREAIARGLDDTQWRSDSIRKGLDRAALFSWRRCATETAAVYARAARA